MKQVVYEGRQGDTAKVLQVVSSVSLAGAANLRFWMKDLKGTVIISAGAAALLVDNVTLEHTFLAPEVVVAGDFLSLFTAELAGKVLTIPDRGYIRVILHPKIS